MSRLFDPIKAASKVSNSVLVAFSGGKDSVVTLDLCCRYFKTVHAFFMYQIPGLSFQEATIRFAENKYGIEIQRLPHFELSEFLAYGSFRRFDIHVPIIGINDVYRFARLNTNTWWIAAGERIADSIVRRAMMKRSGCIDERRGRVFPVANFTKSDVMLYIERHKLKFAPETRVIGSSFSNLSPKQMVAIKTHYPRDFEKIVRWFPFVEASIMKHGMNSEAN